MVSLHPECMFSRIKMGVWPDQRKGCLVWNKALAIKVNFCFGPSRFLKVYDTEEFPTFKLVDSLHNVEYSFQFHL